MTIKSIYQIDVDDKAFKAFSALFQKHQAALKSTPVAWKKIAEAQQKGIDGFREMVAEEVSAIQKAKILNQVHETALRLTQQQASLWDRIARGAKSTASEVRGITPDLLKWGSVVTAFSGLIGAGGLFGISRLLGGAADTRRQALGTGSSYGEQKSFETNYGRVADPDFLSRVNEALHDISKRGDLYAAGLTEKDLKGSTSDVAVRLLDALKSRADQTPDQFLNNSPNNKFLSGEGFQRLKNTSREELDKLRSGYGSDRASFGVNDRDQRAAQDLTTQLERAGRQIETSLVNGLVPLAPGLTALSKAVADLVTDLTKDAKPAIDEFTKYLRTPEFKSDMKDFADGISKVAKFFGFFLGSKDPVAAASDAALTGIKGYFKGSGALSGPAAAFGGASAGGGSGLGIKPGAGSVDAGLGRLGEILQKNIPGLGIVTAANDKYHKGFESAHNDDRALDFRINDPKQAPIIAQKIREELARLGIKGTVLDEYTNPSKHSTAPHMHVQTASRVDIHISQEPGANVVVAAKQVAQ